MTESQIRWYAANKGSPEFKAARLAAVKRHAEKHPERVAATAKLSRLRRQESETEADRLHASAAAAARHALRMRDPAYRERRRLQSAAERRRVAADPLRRERARLRAQSRQAGRDKRVVKHKPEGHLPCLPGAHVPNSVFALGGMGGNPPCKRSEADPALSRLQPSGGGRGYAPSPSANDAPCLDKQIGVNQ